jgi:RNA polymerase sigma-70 factor, ECF subfamily
MEKSDIGKKEFDEFFRNHAETLRRHILFRVEGPELADDLVQEAFLKAWSYHCQKNTRIKDLKNFLYRVSGNLIIDHYRAKPQLPLSLSDAVAGRFFYQPEYGNELDRQRKQRLVRRQLELLDQKHRQILSYRFIKDLSIQEISQSTRKSPNYVSVLIHEAVKELKKQVLSAQR